MGLLRLICFWENDKAEGWGTSRSISRIPWTVIDHLTVICYEYRMTWCRSGRQSSVNATTRNANIHIRRVEWILIPRWVLFVADVVAVLPSSSWSSSLQNPRDQKRWQVGETENRIDFQARRLVKQAFFRVWFQTTKGYIVKAIEGLGIGKLACGLNDAFSRFINIHRYARGYFDATAALQRDLLSIQTAVAR